MSDSPLIVAIQRRLRVAEYEDLSTPLRVAGVDFAFTGAMRGREGRALDLVLLVDTTTGDFGDRSANRVVQRIQALSRALDVTGSRYVVTVVLAGAILTESVESLSETCRVLQLEGVALDQEGNPVDAVATQQLDDRIRVLLPLKLPDPAEANGDASLSVMEQLLKALPVVISQPLASVITDASQNGEQAVTDAVGRMIGAAFTSNQHQGEA